MANVRLGYDGQHTITLSCRGSIDLITDGQVLVMLASVPPPCPVWSYSSFILLFGLDKESLLNTEVNGVCAPQTLCSAPINMTVNPYIFVNFRTLQQLFLVEKQRAQKKERRGIMPSIMAILLHQPRTHTPLGPKSNGTNILFIILKALNRCKMAICCSL